MEPNKVYDSVAAADWLAKTCGDILTHWAYDQESVVYDLTGLGWSSMMALRCVDSHVQTSKVHW